MKFLRGPATFSRHRVLGPRLRDFGGDHLARLRDRRAGTQRVLAADGSQVGWAAGRHAQDTDFALEKNVFPDHMMWDYWHEANKLPADRLQVYYETGLKALCRDNPSGRPTPRQRKEAKASAREQLEQEAKDGRFKKWTLTPVLWDAARGEVLFGATSAAAVARFARLFGETFRADLTQAPGYADAVAPATAGRLALRLDPGAAHSQLSAFVPGVTPDAARWCGPDDLDFLGNEFVLWLWYRTGAVSDTLRLGDGSDCTLMLSGGVRLDCPRGATGDDTINAEAGTRTPEAREGLKTGKLPRKAGVTLARSGEQFSFRLHAETLAVSAARLPKPDGDLVGRAADEHRLGALRTLSETVDLLYARFVSLRLSADWPAELADVQAWVRKGAKVRA